MKRVQVTTEVAEFVLMKLRAESADGLVKSDIMKSISKELVTKDLIDIKVTKSVDSMHHIFRTEFYVLTEEDMEQLKHIVQMLRFKLGNSDSTLQDLLKILSDK